LFVALSCTRKEMRRKYKFHPRAVIAVVLVVLVVNVI